MFELLENMGGNKNVLSSHPFFRLYSCRYIAFSHLIHGDNRVNISSGIYLTTSPGTSIWDPSKRIRADIVASHELLYSCVVCGHVYSMLRIYILKRLVQ